MFTRLDSERNAKVMKKAVNERRLHSEKYKVITLSGHSREQGRTASEVSEVSVNISVSFWINRLVQKK